MRIDYTYTILMQYIVKTGGGQPCMFPFENNLLLLTKNATHHDK